MRYCTLVITCSVFLLTFVSCDESSWKRVTRLYEKAVDFEDKLYETSWKPVPGKDATAFLAKAYPPQTTDVNALLEALTVAENEQATANLVAAGLVDSAEEEKIIELSNDAANLLVGMQKKKLSHDSATFVRSAQSHFIAAPPGLVDSEEASYVNDTVAWSYAANQFTVSMLGKMPVRDQQQRNTCASFAGIAQIEAMIYKQYGGIEAVDLSEQRFYFLSKPKSWADGGDISEGGSNSGTGFSVSALGLYDIDKTTLDPPSDYRIPLESDCPYNGKPGTTDLQVATSNDGGCIKGVVNVQEYTAWLHDWEKRPNTAQDIYDIVANDDIPVVVATRLSSNWEDNDGIITYAESGFSGDSVHAGGHAYLVVGAKKLDETKFPGEGGMCFYIRNSWGTGWGVKGMSCMTLKWFNYWRYETAFPFVRAVDLDTEHFKNAKSRQKVEPSVLAQPDPKTKGVRSAESAPEPEVIETQSEPKRRGRVTIAGLTSGLVVATTSTLGTLFADNDQVFQVLYDNNGTSLTIRGILADGNQLTHDLTLALSGSSIVYPVEDRGKRVFGQVDGNNIILCSNRYAQVCDLHYIAEANELVIGPTKFEAARKDCQPEPAAWETFASFSGYAIEYQIPSGLNTDIDLRFKMAGQTTNCQRLTVKTIGGGILFGGQQVGDYQKFKLCNGDFRGLCRIVVAAENFHLLFKAKK